MLGKNGQAKNGVNCRILAFTIDRWMQLEREASIGGIFRRIPDLTPFFAFTGGIFQYREGIFIAGRG